MARPSGYSLSTTDIPIVLGMAARGDRNHDIAAWFGVNQGRIKEAKDGRYGSVQPAPETALPPSGPPGIKGRRLKTEVRSILDALSKQGSEGLETALKKLSDAIATYERNEQ